MPGVIFKVFIFNLRLFLSPLPVPGAVGCFISQVTVRKHFFHHRRAWHCTQDTAQLASAALADKGLCAACSFSQLCSEAPHRIEEKLYL